MSIEISRDSCGSHPEKGTVTRKKGQFARKKGQFAPYPNRPGTRASIGFAGGPRARARTNKKNRIKKNVRARTRPRLAVNKPHR